MTTRKHLYVHGVVQGVCFRMYTQETAQRLGLRGWVRNVRDGRRVEIEVEGDDAAVASFLEWCREGPRSARVDRVEVTRSVGSDDLPPFTVRPTA